MGYLITILMLSRFYSRFPHPLKVVWENRENKEQSRKVPNRENRKKWEAKNRYIFLSISRAALWGLEKELKMTSVYFDKHGRMRISWYCNDPKTPRSNRGECGAKTRKGTPCKASPVWCVRARQT